jgi:hypothetical protein
VKRGWKDSECLKVLLKMILSQKIKIRLWLLSTLAS